MAIEMEKGSVSIDAQNIMPVIKRWLYSDKDIFLREVVSNGCDAITKYRMTNPDDESEMSVMVTVDKENKTLTISDTGIGIPPEHQERVFERFYRVDKSHSKESGGTGLGLSIVKHAVQDLGGRIELDSTPGEGTEIKVYLPLKSAV